MPSSNSMQKQGYGWEAYAHEACETAMNAFAADRARRSPFEYYHTVARLNVERGHEYHVSVQTGQWIPDPDQPATQSQPEIEDADGSR